VETICTWQSRRLIPLVVLVILAAALGLGGPGCKPSEVSGPPPATPIAVPPGPAPADPPATPQPSEPTERAATSLAAHFIDVGQGDAILLLVEPSGVAVLIDGGTRSSGQKVVQYLKAQGVEQLDLLIGTHPHEDHIGGLIAVLGAFPVKRVIDSGVPHTSKTWDDYMTGIETQVEAGHCAYETPEGQSVKLASNVTLEVLGPEGKMDSLNNASVVCRVDFGETAFLFTGDAETAAEAKLLASGANLKADVLKVGHHGSSTSTSAAFLAAVAPSRAVISVGTGNTYGHPKEITLTRLASAGVTIYRTDTAGTVVLVSDGTSITTDAVAWAEAPSEPQAKGLYVGSAKSDKYHRPTCNSVASISADNQVWFASAEAAQNAGYKPCGTCKPPTK